MKALSSNFFKMESSFRKTLYLQIFIPYSRANRGVCFDFLQAQLPEPAWIFTRIFSPWGKIQAVRWGKILGKIQAVSLGKNLGDMSMSDDP